LFFYVISLSERRQALAFNPQGRLIGLRRAAQQQMSQYGGGYYGNYNGYNSNRYYGNNYYDGSGYNGTTGYNSSYYYDQSRPFDLDDLIPSDSSYFGGYNNSVSSYGGYGSDYE